MLVSAANDELLNGDVGSRDETDQSHQADDNVLDDHPQRQALCVIG